MTTRQKRPTNPPEQKAANELWQALGVTSNADGVARVRELLKAVATEPLLMMMAINRTTGQFVVSTTVKSPEDVQRLHGSVLSLAQQLGDTMAKKSAVSEQSSVDSHQKAVKEEKVG